MADEDSVDMSQDNSIEFRKCWALGEDYYTLRKYYDSIGYDKSGSEKDKSKFFVFYWSRVEAIQYICESLEIKDDRINSFLEELQNERDNLKPHDPNRNFETGLEYLIRGNLMGKDPRYEYIFRAAKQCTRLYETDDDDQKNVEKFLTSLNYLKNFVPSDHIALIKSVVSDWGEVQEEYEECIHKHRKGKIEERGEKSPVAELRRPELVGIVNTIGGLILGVTDISDLLNRWDHFEWVIICYVFVILIIVLFILTLITLPASLYILSQLDFTKTHNFETFITSLGVFLGSVLAVYKVLIVGWQKFASYVERCLATQRLKHPQNTKKRIFHHKLLHKF